MIKEEETFSSLFNGVNITPILKSDKDITKKEGRAHSNTPHTHKCKDL